MIRTHQTIGKTPAEATRIPSLNGFKWHELLKLATHEKKSSMESRFYIRDWSQSSMTKVMDTVVLVFRILGVMAVILGLMGLVMGVALYIENAKEQKQITKAALQEGVQQIPGVSGPPYWFWFLFGSLYSLIGASFMLVPLYISRRSRRRDSNPSVLH